MYRMAITKRGGESERERESEWERKIEKERKKEKDRQMELESDGRNSIILATDAHDRVQKNDDSDLWYQRMFYKTHLKQ